MCSKNNIRIVISIISCFYLYSLKCEGQLIDNKITICGEYVTGSFAGKEIINDRNFIYPSLFGNLKNINGNSFKILYKISPFLSLGGNIMILHASMGDFSGPREYWGSKINFQSFAPGVHSHTRFSNTGFFNRGNLFIDIAPVIGISKLVLQNPLFDIQSNGISVASPLTSRDFYYGALTNLGLEFAISHSFGIIMDYSLQYYRANSRLFADDHFLISQTSFGIFLRLKKDKHFLYR
jgi:hypothetical protein